MGKIRYGFVFSRFALVLGSLVFTLLLLEGLVRVFLPQQLIGSTVDLWFPAERYGWRRKPNLDVIVNTGEGDARLLTDDNGYRIGPDHRADGSYRILALGDSFVAALQVDYEQTMTARLEEALSAELGETVAVVNSGVGGWNPNQYLFQARDELPQSKYDLAIVFIYMLNDVVDAQVNQYPPVQSIVKPKLRLPRQLTRSELNDAINLPVRDYLEKHAHLYILFQEKTRFMQMRAGTMTPYFPPVMLRSEADSPDWAVTANIAAELANEAAQYGVPVLFVLLPAVHQINETWLHNYIEAVGIAPELIDVSQPSRLLTAEFAARQLTVVDAADALKTAYAAGQTNLYGNVDKHFSPEGHQIVADFLKPIILNLLAP